MVLRIVMADPAGNRTAIVRSPVPAEERARIASLLLADKTLGAEQAGFEAAPVCGGEGRLEMMGGEFCGNAARSYGFLLWNEKRHTRMTKEKTHLAEVRPFLSEKEDWDHGEGEILIEISGASEPIRVRCESAGRSFAGMPMPERLENTREGYPIVISEGIAHIILEGMEPDEDFIGSMLDRYGKEHPALGLMFINGSLLCPVVWVAASGSLVYESSCGSGSLAAAWYLAQKEGRTPESIPEGNSGGSSVEYTFREPGGTLSVRLWTDTEGSLCADMGGCISLEKEIRWKVPEDGAV